MSTARAASAQILDIYTSLAVLEEAGRAAVLANSGAPTWSGQAQNADLISWAVIQATSGVSDGIGYSIEAAHLAAAIEREAGMASASKAEIYLSISADSSRQAEQLMDEGSKRAGVAKK